MSQNVGESRTNLPMYDVIINATLLGKDRIGKTSFLRNIVESDKKYNGYIATLGVDLTTKMQDFNDKKTKFNLYDTSGKDQFLEMAEIYTRFSNNIIFFIDVEDEKSLNYFLVSDFELKDKNIILIEANVNKPKLEKKIDSKTSSASDKPDNVETLKKKRQDIINKFNISENRIFKYNVNELFPLENLYAAFIPHATLEAQSTSNYPLSVKKTSLSNGFFNKSSNNQPSYSFMLQVGIAILAIAVGVSAYIAATGGIGGHDITNAKPIFSILAAVCFVALVYMCKSYLSSSPPAIDKQISKGLI